VARAPLRNDWNVERAQGDLGLLTELFASFRFVWHAYQSSPGGDKTGGDNDRHYLCTSSCGVVRTGRSVPAKKSDSPWPNHLRAHEYGFECAYWEPHWVDLDGSCWPHAAANKVTAATVAAVALLFGDSNANPRG
jgi:hypothetical protein